VGIAWMLLTGLLFVSVTGIVRHLGSDMPAAQAAFIRYAFGTLLVLPIVYRLLKKSSYRLPSLAQYKLYALRGMAHGVAVMLWFYAMARIPIAEVTAIGYTSPIFTTIGAAVFLGEVFHVRRIAAIVIAFIGAMIILRPGFQTIELGALSQLLAAPFFAASFLLAKKLTGTRSPEEIVVMLSIGCTVVLLPVALWQWQTPTTIELFWLLLTAVFATVGHYTLTRAFACAPLTATQPISFLQLVWASLLGYFVFGESLDPWVILGGGVIVASVTYIFHRESAAVRLGRSLEK
jgi:drug/metabolite transporter (DMT)-like permease|tara:strand:- start:1033 stop:1905 length:873 start_codon:yes stop_codon:yes gene_type:complete